MVTKTTIYDLLQASHSRYRAMLGSENKNDQANAEVYRLSTQEWQECALVMNSPDFDPARHLERLRARWNVYVQTGKPHDNIESFQARRLQELVDEDRRLRGIEKPPESPRPRRSKGIEVIGPDDPRNFLDPKIIEGILNEFRQAFGMEMVDHK